MDGAGNVYVADTQNGTIRKVTAGGVVSTLAGTAGSYGSGDGTGRDARFNGPQGVVADSAGTVYVADSVNHTIRKIATGGAVTTLAGVAGLPGIDDGPGSTARFYQPRGLALDSGGNLFVADSWNHTIRKITPGGVVSTLAGLAGNPGCSDGTGSQVGTNTARFNCPAGLAVDGAGNVYVADSFNHTIRKVTAAGVVSTLAGWAGVWGNADGTGRNARFFQPGAVVVDGANNLYVLDSGNHTIRKLAASGTNWVVTTVAGVPSVSGSSDGVGSGATFDYPAGLALAGADLFYIADAGNNAVRLGMLVNNGAPGIVTQPQSQTADPGNDVTFTVGAVGQAPLAYQWRFNQTPIAGATASSYTRSNAQGPDGGEYSVVVTNSAGSVLSAIGRLTVSGPPFITGQPQGLMVVPGQTATFAVVASGTAPLSYQWQFNGNPIPDGTGPSLTLTSVQRPEGGAYSVLVMNALGLAVSENALLTFPALEAWGNNTYGQLAMPADSGDTIAIAAGAWHNLALRRDGTVMAWGDDSDGQCAVPEALQGALAIAAGGYHSLAVRPDCTVAAWGASDYGQTNVPAGLANVIGISAGSWHSLALRRNGTVVAWGDNTWGQCNVPGGLSNVVAVAAGGNHSLALRADGTVAAWGENTGAAGNPAGQSVVPVNLNNVVAIAAGDYHSLAVRADGTVVAWGDDSDGQCSIPNGLSNVVAIAGGGAHTLAVTASGAVVAWGANWNGQCELPSDLSDVNGLGAGKYHSVALMASSIPVPQLLSPVRQGTHFSVLAQTLNRRTYALEYKETLDATNWNMAATNSGNGSLRQLLDAAATASQRFYRMRQW